MLHTNQCERCNKIWESDELPNYCPCCRCSTLKSTNNESNSGRVLSYNFLCDNSKIELGTSKENWIYKKYLDLAKSMLGDVEIEKIQFSAWLNDHIQVIWKEKGKRFCSQIGIPK